ncbi:unnamed protein product [Calypogeia fissa]
MKNFKRTKLQVRADFRAAADCADISAPGDAVAVSVARAGAATTSTHAAAPATMNKFKTNANGPLKMKSFVETKDISVGVVVPAIGGGTSGGGGAPTNPPAAWAATAAVKQCTNKRKGDHPKKTPSGCISKSRVGAGTASTIAVGVSASTTTLAGAGSTIGSASGTAIHAATIGVAPAAAGFFSAGSLAKKVELNSPLKPQLI